MNSGPLSVAAHRRTRRPCNTLECFNMSHMKSWAWSSFSEQIAFCLPTHFCRPPSQSWAHASSDMKWGWARVCNIKGLTDRAGRSVKSRIRDKHAEDRYLPFHFFQQTQKVSFIHTSSQSSPVFPLLNARTELGIICSDLWDAFWKADISTTAKSTSRTDFYYE